MCFLSYYPYVRSCGRTPGGSYLAFECSTVKVSFHRLGQAHMALCSCYRVTTTSFFEAHLPHRAREEPTWMAWFGWNESCSKFRVLPRLIRSALHSCFYAFPCVVSEPSFVRQVPPAGRSYDSYQLQLWSSTHTPDLTAPAYCLFAFPASTCLFSIITLSSLSTSTYLAGVRRVTMRHQLPFLKRLVRG